MKIGLYWPGCKYTNGNWCNEKIDSFWVECTPEEAIKKVFPFLSDTQKKESKKNFESEVYVNIDNNNF
ncbi:hypothetical protein SDC9_53209 [bioreactor metagenome]|uniref:Uncharacterized protein n=1 Tax=bioreactor metagenome TaxID=1076179 RepID=A0A644WSL3_9ZZZZ|nr:hypothetical protein [Oscillospiraceae bacterium]